MRCPVVHLLADSFFTVKFSLDDGVLFIQSIQFMTQFVELDLSGLDIAIGFLAKWVEFHGDAFKG